MHDPLFVGSHQRRDIIKSYIKLKLKPHDGMHTMVRRVVDDLKQERGKSYKLNKNGTSTFVSEVIRDFEDQVKNERDNKSV